MGGTERPRDEAHLAREPLLAQENLRSQTNHHAASTKQQDEIIAQNKEIKGLLEQHSGDLAFTNTLLKELAQAGKEARKHALALYLIASQVAVCQATGAQCPVPPQIQGVDP